MSNGSRSDHDRGPNGENLPSEGLCSHDQLNKGSSKAVMFLEVFSATVWWTVVHGITPLLSNTISSWLFLPLISLSPLLLYADVIRSSLSTPLGLLLLRLLTLCGCAILQLQHAHSQAIGMGIGTTAATLVLASSWWKSSYIDKYRRLHYHVLGLLLMLSLRVCCATYNPFFLSKSLNVLFLLLSAVIAIVLYNIDWRTPILRTEENEKIVKEFDPTFPVANLFTHIDYMWAGLGFACQLFIIQTMFGDISIALTWATKILASPQGSILVPQELFVLVPLGIGLILGHDDYRHLTTSWQWLVLGIGCFSIPPLTSSTTVITVTILAIYTTSLWPQLSHRLTLFPAWIVLTATMAIYFVLLVASSLLGPLLVNCLQFGAIFLMWYSLRKYVAEHGGDALREEQRRRWERRHSSYVMMFGKAIRRLSTVPEESEEYEEEEEEEEDVNTVQIKLLLIKEQYVLREFDKKIIPVLLSVCLLAAIGALFWNRLLLRTHEPSVEMTAMILGKSINHDQSIFDLTNPQELTQNADIICLPDTRTSFTGEAHPSQWLAGQLGMVLLHGPHDQDQQMSMLSRFHDIKADPVIIDTNAGDTYAVGMKAIFHSSDEPVIEIYCLASSGQSSIESDNIMKSSKIPVLTMIHSANEYPTSKCNSTTVYYNKLIKVSQECSIQSTHNLTVVRMSVTKAGSY